MMFPWTKNKRDIKELSEKIASISIVKKSIPRSYYLNPKGQDASNYVEDILNHPYKQFRGGHFLLTKPVTLEIQKDLICPNTVFYVKENHDVLRIANDYTNLKCLTIDNSLVKNPQREFNLITLMFKLRNMQNSVLEDITLIGNEDALRNKAFSGATALKWDSTTDSNGELNEAGESHHIKINRMVVYFQGLGLLMSNNPEHNERNASNSEHTINMFGLGCKKLAEFNNLGKGTEFHYAYQNRQILREDEKENDLVTLNSDFVRIIRPELYDPQLKEKKTRLGIDLYGHDNIINNYCKHNILQDYDYNTALLKGEKFKINK